MSTKAAPEAKAPAPVVARSFTPARAPLLQRKCACGNGSSGGCEECTGKKLPLQRSAAGPSVSGVPPIVNRVLSSPGRSLDAGTRSFMESRFGHDFAGVRLHTDSQAAESARAVKAHAYTVGQDVVFAHGQYAPETTRGRSLLAHELAHTIQQRGLQRSGSGISSEHDAEYQRLEREADSAAAAVMHGGPISLNRSASRPTLSRADDETQDGTVKPAKSTTPKTKTSSLGLHLVTPTEVFTMTVEGSENAIEEFNVDKFYIPATKGPKAAPIYLSMAGKGLETTVEIQGTGKTKTALWQLRPPTDDLRDIWLEKVGWTKSTADDLWERSGGDKTFPQVGGKTCQMDHIVELQIGGNNVPQNIQPLDATQNQSSGGAIKGELQTLALAISNDRALSSGSAQQIKLRFQDVKQVGTPEKLPASCPAKAPRRTCLAVEDCATKLKVEKSETGAVVVARADYPITAGGRPPTNLKVPVTFATRATELVLIETDSQNASAATLIPGLLLTNLAHRKGVTAKPDVIEARIDDRDKTRLPISINPSTKPLHLNVATDGNLTLNPADKKGGIAFTYKYLSPGRITEISLDESGETAWKGTIRPSIPFLGDLGVEYSKNSLVVTKGLDEAALMKRSILGMHLTKAQIQLQLAPEFRPEGVVEAQLGSGDAPIARASLKIGADSIGLIADGKLKVNIPRMQTSEVDISYKGGEERNEWKAEIHIKSEDIQLGSSVSVSGGFDGFIEKGDIKFSGKINATFPGENTAELGLKRGADGWVLFGGGTFHFPKLDPTTVSVRYFLAKDTLVATGKTGFKIPAIGLGGRLDEVTFTIAKDQPAKVYGKGGLDFKKGKAEGHADVELHPSGKFTGKGSLSYKIKENIIVTGTVELNEKEKLRVTGELLITRYEIFKQYGDKKDLFTLDVPVPIPGLSIGTTGLVFHIRGGVGVAYSFGPGTLEPLRFSAGFDPLEEDPDLELTVTGSVKVPASATLSAGISGSLSVQVDILVGSAGAEGGLELRGDLILSAGAFANFDAAYKKKRLTAKLVAGIDTKLLLGLALTAFARAWAGAFGISGEIRKDWTLAKKTIDTHIGFFISAPFEYADDTGVKLPEFKDITLKKPEITTDNLKRILGELFGSASEKEVQK